jgi:hypothetical protein
MVLNRFCKLVGSLYLILFWCPLLWVWVYANLFGHDLYNAIGMSREELLRFSPSTLSDTYLVVSFWIFLLATLGLAIWLFFPGNWLERLILWLSPDGKRLILTEIIIDDSAGQDPLEPVPVKIVGPLPAASPEEPQRHPDEKYMPPQYRH